MKTKKKKTSRTHIMRRKFHQNFRLSKDRHVGIIDKKLTRNGRDMLFANTNKHIRLLNDKVCCEIISVQRVNSKVGKKEFCWLLTLFGGLLFREFISQAV